MNKEYLKQSLEMRNKRLIQLNTLYNRLGKLRLPNIWVLKKMDKIRAARDNDFRMLREIIRKEKPELFIGHDY